MKVFTFLTTLILLFLTGCQVKSESPAGVVEDHQSVDAKFTLSTTLNKSYPANANIDFKLTFPKAVIVSGVPRLNITIGNTAHTADYQSGSGTKVLVFRYVTQSGDTDNNGVSVSNPIDLNGATLKYETTKDCNSTITIPSLATVLVDTTTSTITLNTPPTPGAYTPGMPINFTFTFSENVVVTGTPRVPLTVGATTRYASYVSGNGTSNLVFRYTAQGSDLDTDGIETDPLELNGGSIKDRAGNVADLTHAIPDTSMVILPGSIPLITSVSLPPNAIYKTGQTLNFVVNFNQPVLVTLVPRLAITIESGTVYADYSSGAGTSNLMFTYVVQPGDYDSNGLTMVPPLDLNGGTIQNLAMTLNASLIYIPSLTPNLKVDGISPLIDSVEPPLPLYFIAGNALNFIVHYDYPVVVTGTPRIPIAIGATPVFANYVSGSGTADLIFRYTVLANQEDLDGIEMSSPIALNGGTIKDPFGDNAGLTYTIPDTTGVLVDAIVPTIISVSEPATGTYYIDQDLEFTINTSEDIIVTGVPRIALTIGSTVKYATYHSGSASSSLVFKYTVLAGDSDIDGIVAATPLDLNVGTLRDAAGNNLGLTFTPPSMPTVLVDGLVASIVSVTPPANTKYVTGNDLDFTVKFTRAVDVTGAPRLTLNIGGQVVFGDYVSGSGTDELVFRYTVIANDEDADGIQLSSPVGLNSGTIQDSSLQNATLTFIPPSTTGVTVDGVDLVITSITPPADKTYLFNEQLNFTVNFNNNATVTGSPRITLTVGSDTLYAIYTSGSGTNAHIYRYTVSATDLDADGINTVGPTLDLNAGTIKDAFGDDADTNFTDGNLANVRVEGSVPTILSVAGPSSNTYFDTDPLNFTVNFSEPVNVVGSPRIALTIGSIAKYAVYQSGSGTDTLVFRYLVVGGDTDLDGIASASPLQLNGGTVKDLAGNDLNPLTFTPPDTTGVIVDANQAVIISVTPPTNAKYVTGNNLDFTVLFSRTVDVVGVPRIALTVGAATLFATYQSGTGTNSLTFRYTVSAGDKDINGLGLTSPIDLNSGTITDSNSVAAFLTYTLPNTSAVLVDGIELAISSLTLPADDTYLFNENLEFTVNYNYAAIVLGTPRITLTVGATTRYASYVSGSGTSALLFRYTVGATDEDINGIDSVGPNLDLNSGSIKDEFGDDANLLFTNGNYPNKKIDGIIPTVLSVTGTAPGTYYEGQNLDFTATFSESMTITGSPRIALTIGSTTRYANYHSGSGSPVVIFRYTVVAGDVDSDGIASTSPLSLNSGDITDLAGNQVASLVFTPPNTVLTYVDATTATILALNPPANSTYITSSNLDFTATFSRIVNVTGTPRIQITVGSTTVYANYLSGSGSTALVFRYTVVSGNADIDGVTLISQVGLNGGTITDSSTANADLTYTLPNTSGILVDGIDLAIASITPPSDNLYINNSNLDFTVNYNFPATVTGTPRIILTIGSTTRYANYVSGSGTSALLFRYTVSGTDLDTDGINTNGTEIDLNSGTIKDLFGDNANITISSGNISGVLVDGIVPSISSVTGPTTGTYYFGSNLDFTVNFSEAIDVSGIPRIQLTIGSNTRYATYLSGAGSTSAVFRYVVASGDVDADGIGSTSPLQLNSGTLEDLAGNPVTPLTFTTPTTTGVLVSGNSADVANSTITGSGPIVANGVAVSNITITLKDSSNVAVIGITPTFSATNTGSGNVQTACSPTNASGESNCTLKSTKAETKTLSILTPISKSDGTVVFTPGPVVAATSTITGTGPVTADNVATSTITITLNDINNNPISGTTPTFTATNTVSGNTQVACGATNALGIATCGLRSTKAETKTLSIATPVVKAGGTVVFNAGSPAVANSSISGTTPVSADGVSVSFITISLNDAFGNPVTGVSPIYNATGSNNNYGAGCSVTDATGNSACSLASITAELKNLQLTSPISVPGMDPIEFSALLPTSANSTITGTSPVLADGSTDSTITITLRDVNNNPVAGLTPLFDATNTGGGNTYDVCSMTDAGGVSVCTMASTKAESKILRITSPVTKSDGTVIFTAGAPEAATSTIAGTGPVVADGTAVSTITILLKDVNDNPVSGTTPTFGATNTGSGNTQTVCGVTDAAGSATCTLRSTKAESKIPSILTPVIKAGTAISFIAGLADATTSTITGTGPVNPDGVSTSTITVTLRDANGNFVAGTTPTIGATGTNNTFGACNATNSSGVSTCTLASTTAETKTLSIVTPVAKSDGTVIFETGSAVALNSTIIGTGPVVANGVATSNVTITLKDSGNNPVVGVVPLFTATGTSNSYAACSASDLNGQSLCAMTSTRAQDKALSITSPVIKVGNTLTFVPGPPSALTSTIVAEDPNLADGVDVCDVAITILDAYGNGIGGETPTYSVTGTLNTTSACTVTDAAGQSLCTVTSTKAEGKTFQLLTPISVAGNTVDFNPNGIDIQVPIEMADRGLSSNTTAITFNRTRTSLNTADYVAETNDYIFEVIADNTNTTTTYTIYLIDSDGVQITDSAIAIPPSTTARRFRVLWTPNTGASNYRVRVPATTSANQVRIHSAKMIVEQTKAVATKIYIPLVGGDVSGESNSDTGGTAATTTSASFTQGTASWYYHWVRSDAEYDALDTTNPWTLETVTSSNNAAGVTTAALFDKINNAQITPAQTTVTGTTVSMNQVSFAGNAANFNDGDTMELRLRSSSTAYSARLFKAGLWLKLKYLKKAEIFQRLTNRRSASSTATLPDGRLLWDAGAWSNPTLYFQTMGNSTTSTIAIRGHATNDFGTTSTTAVTNGTITQPTTYGSTRSAAITLVDQDRYIVTHTRTSGTVVMGGTFLVIRATE